MHSTYWTPCDSSTNACVIGTANNIVASPSSGITLDKKSFYQCPTTSTKPLPSFSTLSHKNGRINPYPHVKPTYEAKKQYSQVEDDSPNLDKAGKKFIQEVCGVFLYLAHAVNGGLLPALSSLASQEANPTEKTMELCIQFLDYMTMQEDAILTYHANNMVLAIHSNASYSSEPKYHSRAGGHMFIAGKDNIPFNNGAVINI
jgi:hypothetical protein